MTSLSSTLAILPRCLDSVPTAGLADLLFRYFQRLARLNGEFPGSLSHTQDVSKYASGGMVTPEQVAELISIDPVLCLRLLIIANSTAFGRSNPTESILGVVQQLGYRRVAESAENCVEARNFQAVFLGRAISAGVLQQLVYGQEIARLLFARLMPRATHRDRAALWSVLPRLPILLLSFIRPQLYAALCLDQAQQIGRNLIERNFKRLLGKSVTDMAVEMFESLSLPLNLTKILSEQEVPAWNRRGAVSTSSTELLNLSNASFIGARLAEEICKYSGKQALDELINEYAEKSAIDKDLIQYSVGEATLKFVEKMRILGLRSYSLPKFLYIYQEEIVGQDGLAKRAYAEYPSLSELINPYLYELRAALKVSTEEPFGHLSQAVLCTQHALVKVLGFQRAVLYRHNRDKQQLEPISCFGYFPQQLQLVNRKIEVKAAEHMPDVQAIRQRKCIFFGDPVFGEDWPFVAFPIVSKAGVEAVFYADRRASDKAAALDTSEQVSAVALAEEWQDVNSAYH